MDMLMIYMDGILPAVITQFMMAAVLGQILTPTQPMLQAPLVELEEML